MSPEHDDLSAARGIASAVAIMIAVGLITWVVVHWPRW